MFKSTIKITASTFFMRITTAILLLITTTLNPGRTPAQRADVQDKAVVIGPLIAGVAFSPDGKLMASASGGLRSRKTSDGRYVTVDSFAPPGSKTLVELWDTTTGRLMWRFEIGVSRVHSIDFARGGKTLVLQSYDTDRSGKIVDTTRLLQVDNGTLVGSIERGFACGFAFSPDDTIVAFPSEGGAVTLMDVTSGAVIRRIEGHTSAVTALAFSADGKALASAGRDVIKLWEVDSGKLMNTYKDAGESTSLGFSADERIIAAGGFHNRVTLWDVASGELVRDIHWNSHNRTLVGFSGGFDFNADGKTIATWSGGDNITRVWDINSGRLIRSFPSEEGHLRSGMRFLAKQDGTIAVQDAASGKLIRRLTVGANGEPYLATSSDGKTIAAWCCGNVIRVWSLDSSTAPRSLVVGGDGDSTTVGECQNCGRFSFKIREFPIPNANRKLRPGSRIRQ